jgi:hypothetical protein
MTTASTTSAKVTALERHASFFDPTGSGRITCGQTYAGMKRLGVPFLLRLALVPLINGFLGLRTQGHVSFVIRIDRISQGKHPYDTGSFDMQGAFDPAAFDALFANAGDAITEDEMRAVITSRGDRLPKMGWLVGVLGHWFSSREVGVFFRVAADTRKTMNGREVAAVKKETLRSFYGGTLFDEIAERRRAG